MNRFWISILLLGMFFSSCSNTRKIEELKVRVDQIELSLEEMREKIMETDYRSPVLKEIINNMVTIEKDTFLMGCSMPDSSLCNENEFPVHTVVIDSFSISKFELTQRQWKTIMGQNPSRNRGCELCPVENVSWDDVQLFIKKINELSGLNYRLPTEAEWEYAAKATNYSLSYAGADLAHLIGWYFQNSNSSTKVVGRKFSNKFGLYDMSGNVWEWTASAPNPYPDSDAEFGSENNKEFVIRGGAFNSFANDCRVSKRLAYPSNARREYIGFRLAL